MIDPQLLRAAAVSGGLILLLVLTALVGQRPEPSPVTSPAPAAAAS